MNETRKASLTKQTITVTPTITIEIPADKVLIDRETLEQLQREARPLVWSVRDAIRQIGGCDRGRFDAIIRAHEDELLEIHAFMQRGAGSRPTKFRVSVFAPWLDEHLEEFGTGAAHK